MSTINFLPQDVFTYLSLNDISKACGPDLITGFVLKSGAEFIASPLSYLFMTSMHTATLPKDWVTANVVPVFKRDDKSVVKNYRPISLTSLVVKTMERIIYSQVLSVLEPQVPVNMDSERIVQHLIFWYKLYMTGLRL